MRMAVELRQQRTAERPTRPDLETLIHAATLAPSGDNTQPWRFVVDADRGTIEFHVDPTRDPSPMNAGQRMARIAIGAALENAVRTAQHNGWKATLEPPKPPALAMLRIHGDPSSGGEIEEVIRNRVTNRRVYDGRNLDPELLARLRSLAPELEGVTTHWIVSKERIIELASLIGKADAMMLGDPTMRRAFLKKVRFERPPDERVEDGLSLASLELSLVERRMLKLLRYLPNWFLTMAGMQTAFADKARQLVRSASGFCLIAAPDSSEETDLIVGRVVETAWLALTESGLAVQPMMSPMVLENVTDNGASKLIDAVGCEPLHGLRKVLRRCIPEIGEARPAFLLRFGKAPSPSGRTGRCFELCLERL
jgi:hypothetical protein